MTVVAWDGLSLAADRQVNVGDLIYRSCKVIRLDEETLAGFAGSGARFNQLVAWYRAGHDPLTYPPRPTDDWSVLSVVRRLPGDAVVVERFEGTGYAYPIEDGFYADGAGRDIALAAMHCGRTASEAVELAGKLSVNCGGGCDALSFEPRKP